MSEEIDKSITKKYDIHARLGKGVSSNTQQVLKCCLLHTLSQTAI